MADTKARSLGTEPPLGRLYEVGDRRLWLHRAGEGEPAIVFLAGAGTVGLDYFNVQQRAARLGASVIYDRGGTGFSDPAPAGRSAAATVSELRALLDAAGIRPPYVLVGHSLGGLFARRYAQLFPSEVAGLVLLDPPHEDYDAYMPEQLNAKRSGGSSWISLLLGKLSGPVLGAAVRIAPGLVAAIPVVRRYQELYRRLFTAEMADWPPDLRETLVERHLTMAWFWAGIEEARGAEALYAETRAGGPLPDVPLVILCSMGIDDFRRAVSVGESDEMLAGELAGKRRLYDDLATTVPRGEVRPVDAGHLTIHFRHPQAVEAAIADVLQRVAERAAPAA
ncbi:MAG TPA: alpha/beta fold hydrolase [Caulobacteraceae bacterium]|nr:alpha/beta fold hydrolase [Caulobacteraceae bacterium]